jgi:hypothetical protein
MMDAMRYASEQEDSRNRMIASGIKKLLEGGGSLYDRYKRKSAIESEGVTPEEANDAEYLSAVNQFIETGNLSGLNAYKMRKMQEREQKMREDELSTRKTLAEIENRRGKEEANKIRESQIDDVKTALRKAIVQAESENVTPDIRMNGEIDIEANRKKLSDLGNPVSDEELEKLREKYREKNVKGKSIKTGAEGEVVGSEEVEEDGGLYGSIRAEADIEARKRKLKEITAEYKKNGVTDEQKAELVDVAKRIANETPASKRDDEFLTIMSNIDKLQTKEDVVRYEKGLAKKYHERLGSPARLDRWMRENKDEFEKAEKAHSKYYRK